MQTQIIDVSDLEIVRTEESIDMKLSPKTDAALDLAARTLKAGGLVAFPTETVYGLGGNAFDPQALRKIFEAKGRPSDNPLIIHVTRARDLDRLASKITVKTVKLIDTFWPGPLTVVLPKRPEVPDEATGGLPTVAVRMPSDPVAIELIRRTGLPVAAPSANLSGRPSPTKGSHVCEDLDGLVDVILQGKDAQVGIESTVIDMSGETPLILRPGIITQAQIEKIIGPVGIDPALLRDNPDQPDKQGSEAAPRSPGVKYTHYAPKAHMVVIEGASDEQKSKKIKELLVKAENVSAGIHIKKTALIVSDELAELLRGSEEENGSMLYTYGARNRPEEAARCFFSLLRECDAGNAAWIIAEALPEQGAGFAVMNRMFKAAGHKIISV